MKTELGKKNTSTVNKFKLNRICADNRYCFYYYFLTAWNVWKQLCWCVAVQSYTHAHTQILSVFVREWYNVYFKNAWQVSAQLLGVCSHVILAVNAPRLQNKCFISSQKISSAISKKLARDDAEDFHKNTCVWVHTLTYCMLRFLQTRSLSVHSSTLKRHCPNCILSYCLPFSPSVHSESAVGEGGADDGVVLPALSRPDERRQVPSFCEGPAQELLCHCDVHSSPASTAMFRLQVRPRKQKELTQLIMLARLCRFTLNLEPSNNLKDKHNISRADYRRVEEDRP